MSEGKSKNMPTREVLVETLDVHPALFQDTITFIFNLGLKKEMSRLLDKLHR
jgi:hypothetical protein